MRAAPQEGDPYLCPRRWPRQLEAGPRQSDAVTAALQSSHCRSCRRPRDRVGQWCLELGPRARCTEGNGQSPRGKGGHACR